MFLRPVANEYGMRLCGKGVHVEISDCRQVLMMEGKRELAGALLGSGREETGSTTVDASLGYLS